MEPVWRGEAVKGLPARPGKRMKLSPRPFVSLMLMVMLAVQAGCRSAPSATPEPSASATAPVATATVPAETPTATVEASATPTVARQTPTTPPSPTRPPADATPPPPTTAVLPSPTPVAPNQPPVSSLVVTPGEPPVYFVVADGRLYRSTDRGDTWSEDSAAGLPLGAAFNLVTIDYRHPETMYAATTQGIYRRQGQGSWGLVNTLKARALAVDLENPNVLWAGTFSNTGVKAIIFKSEDAGRTWGKADWGMWGGSVSQILVHPNNPNVLWAINDSGPYLWRGGRDGHWELLDLGPFGPGCESGQCCYPTSIAYDPNANLLFAGCPELGLGRGQSLLLRSPNADAADSSAIRWEAAALLPSEPSPGYVACRPLAVDARTPRSLFVALSFWNAEGGSYDRLLVSHDDGATWEALQLGGLPRSQAQ